MDNLCHTLTGWTIARAGIERLSPWATATCIVAANLPDADLIAGWENELMYLEHHRGITHSIVGLAIQSVLLAAIVRAALWIKTRNRLKTNAQTANYFGLLVAAALGLASHLLLDWTNSYGVRPLLPFDRTRFYGDLVFVVDPWLWLLFGAAIFLGTGNTLRKSTGWLALFALLTIVVIAAAILIAPGELGFAPLVWCALLALIIFAKRRKPDWRKTTLARGAIAAYAVYLILLGALHWRATAAAEQFAAAGLNDSPLGARIEKADALPMPMRPDRWNVFVQTPDRIFNRAYGLNNFDPALTVFDRRLETPAAAAALGTCAGKVAADFSRYLRAEVARDESGQTVDLIDERFPPQNNRRAVGQITIRLNPDSTPQFDRRRCPDLPRF